MNIKQVVSGLRIAQDDLYRLATDGKDNFEIEAIKTAIYAMHELKEYKQLGTLEEVRAAVEKQDPKKVEIWNGQAMCPNCRSLFGNMSDIRKIVAWDMPHCKFCGQAIDWGEEE